MSDQIFDVVADSMAKGITLGGFSFKQDGRNLLKLIQYIDGHSDGSEDAKQFEIKSALRSYNVKHSWNDSAGPMLDALVQLYFASLTMDMEI